MGQIKVWRQCMGDRGGNDGWRSTVKKKGGFRVRNKGVKIDGGKAV